MILDHTVLRATPDMKHQSLGEGQPTVILSLTSGYLYTANDTTRAFLDGIDGEKSFAAVLGELLEAYEVDREELAADLRELAETMVHERLLEVLPPVSRDA